MALLDFLKKKKDAEKSKKPEKKVEKVSVAKEPKEVKEPKAPKAPKAVKTSSVKEGKFSYEVVKEPHISEKSTIMAEEGKYVFKIYTRSNKPQIKKAIEGIYNVDVVSVNVVKIAKKKRRLGRTEGFRKAYSKAVVTIKEGQKIEIY